MPTMDKSTITNVLLLKWMVSLLPENALQIVKEMLGEIIALSNVN